MTPLKILIYRIGLALPAAWTGADECHVNLRDLEPRQRAPAQTFWYCLEALEG